MPCGRGTASDGELNVDALERSTVAADWAAVTGHLSKGRRCSSPAGKSEYVRAEDHAVMRRFFPRARIETLPEADHWPHVTAPDALEASAARSSSDAIERPAVASLKSVSAETQKKRIAGLIAQEWNRLVGYVRSRIEDTAERDAEDVVQDVIEHLFEKADMTEPIADLSGYLFRSLRNRVIDLYRRKRAPAGELSDEIADLRCEAEETMDREEAQEALAEAIEDLPRAQRDVLVATELEGRSFKELAEEWETPIGTLLARKHRAIKALRESLTGGVS